MILFKINMLKVYYLHKIVFHTPKKGVHTFNDVHIKHSE